MLLCIIVVNQWGGTLVRGTNLVQLTVQSERSAVHTRGATDTTDITV
jgi:hypothetical protein